MMPLDRRRLLLLGGGLTGGALLPPAALIGRALAQDRGEDDDEKNDDPGYDLDSDETTEVGTRSFAGAARPPPRFVVDPSFLPPVGDQGRAGSCVSWAAGYGLVTYMVARRDNKHPVAAADQVSAAYLYGTVRNARASGCHNVRDRCRGTTSRGLGQGGTDISMTLEILERWGWVTAAECPYPRVRIAGRKVVPNALYDNIYAAWGAITVDPTLKIRKWHAHAVQLERPDGIDEIKRVIALNEPVVYGTRVPKGWKDDDAFDGSGRPWEHYREVTLKNGKPVGHAMMIVGYDDGMVSPGGHRGAVLVQNSWGTDWGVSWSHAFGGQYPNHPRRSDAKGYAWITYEAFRALAKGKVKRGVLEGEVFSIVV